MQRLMRPVPARAGVQPASDQAESVRFGFRGLGEVRVLVAMKHA